MTMRTLNSLVRACLAAAMIGVVVVAISASPAAQSAPAQQSTIPAQPTPAQPAEASPPTESNTDASGMPLPADYVIGPNDVLTIRYWREETMSAEVAVRPDGKISLPLLNDVQASGLTPDALRVRIVEAASRFVESPVVSVNVKEIKSRKVFITGMVSKPGEYPLIAPTSVIQLIAIAGGLLEFSDSENIMVIRPSEKNFRGDPFAFRVNYKDITRRRNLQQNIELKPGDTVVVP
jgi:polysaccharide export outer membrane protein